PLLFTDPPTTQIYTLSLHDALPISDDFDGRAVAEAHLQQPTADVWIAADADDAPTAADGKLIECAGFGGRTPVAGHKPACLFHKDRKSTRLNSSHLGISYAVFCLKK